MQGKEYPTLKGNTLFRKDELVYVNRSDELREFCGVIHKHDFLEVAYVIEGSGIHIVGGKQYEISKGDLFVINYDIPHGFFAKTGSDKEPVVYNCSFMPGFLDSSLFSSNQFQDIASSFLFKSLFPEDYRPSPDLKLHGAEFNEIGDLYSKMYSEYKGMKKGYCDIIRAYLIELFIKVFRLMETNEPKAHTARNVETVNKAVSYLRRNFNSEVKLDDLAMQSFLSKNYFSRLFREVAGISFSDYIQRLRVDEACSLLRQSDMKVIDIARQVGFKDIKFFYEVFKKITKKTPGDYRQQQRI